jgi:predicted ATPase
MTTELPTRRCRGGGRMAVAALAVALVAACGGGPGNQTSTRASTQTPPSARAVPSTTAAAIDKPCLRAAESTRMFRF